MIMQVLKKEVNSSDDNNQTDTDHHYMPHNRISDEEYNRRKHSEERHSGYRGHDGRAGYHNNNAGQRNSNQLREHNRGNNVNGSIRHQKAYHRIHDSYQNRDENEDKTGSYSHRRKDDGLQHGDDYTGYRKIFSHHSTFRNRDDYTRRDDERGHYQSIHRDTGIAMCIKTWTRTGRGTKLTTGESQM